MAEQNQNHFHVIDGNKAKTYETKKKSKEVKEFIDKCDERKLTEIHCEVLRLKRGLNQNVVPRSRCRYVCVSRYSLVKDWAPVTALASQNQRP